MRSRTPGPEDGRRTPRGSLTPRSALARAQRPQALLDNRSSCTALAWTPQGRGVVCGTSESQVISWDVLDSQRCLQKVDYRQEYAGRSPGGPRVRFRVEAFAFRGPDLVAAANGGDTLFLLDYASGRLDALSDEGVGAGHGPPAPVARIALAASGAVLAFADADGRVGVWDVDSRSAAWPRRRCGELPLALALSNDGRHLAIAHEDGTVSMWFVPSGQRSWTAECGGGSAACLAFSPRGRQLAAGLYTNEVLLLDAERGRPSARLHGHSDYPAQVAYTADGEFLASAGQDGLVIVWDVANGGARVRDLGGTVAPVTALAFGPDGSRLAAACEDGRAVVWELGPLRETAFGGAGVFADRSEWGSVSSASSSRGSGAGQHPQGQGPQGPRSHSPHPGGPAGPGRRPRTPGPDDYAAASPHRPGTPGSGLRSPRAPPVAPHNSMADAAAADGGGGSYDEFQRPRRKGGMEAPAPTPVAGARLGSPSAATLSRAFAIAQASPRASPRPAGPAEAAPPGGRWPGASPGAGGRGPHWDASETSSNHSWGSSGHGGARGSPYGERERAGAHRGDPHGPQPRARSRSRGREEGELPDGAPRRRAFPHGSEAAAHERRASLTSSDLRRASFGYPHAGPGYDPPRSPGGGYGPPGSPGGVRGPGYGGPRGSPSPPPEGGLFDSISAFFGRLSAS